MRYSDIGVLSLSSRNESPISVEKDQVISFISNRYIQSAHALNRMLYYPEKFERQVMKADKPWEMNGKYRCVGGFSGKCIVQQGDKLMMFYSVYHMGGKNEFRSFAYAESKDGYRWTKPDINKGTNLLIDNRDIYDDAKREFKRPYYELQNVIFDEHSGLYRGLGHCRISRQKYGTFVATTNNPIKWNPKEFRLLYKNDDIHALMGWDEDKKGYVSYIRVPIYQNGIQKRAIGYSISADFKKWSEPVLCHVPMGGVHQIYNMPVTKYAGHYLGFPINYYPAPDHPGPLETGLLYSGDGVTWFLQDPQYIQRGLPGEWDDSYVMTAAPFNWKDSMWFYYWGCNFPHDNGFREEKLNVGSVGVAVLPKNRMYSLACNRHSPGVLEVVPFYPRKGCKSVVLNAHLPNGSIEAYDGLDKLALVTKNSLEFYLTKNGKKDWVGQDAERIRLQFLISDAEVFTVTLE